MKAFFGLLLVFVVWAPQVFADPILNNNAAQTIQRVNADLQRCGLLFYDARDVRLPRPPLDARFAIINRYGRLLAYYRENVFAGRAHYHYSNPDGTFPHGVQLTNDEISYYTPHYTAARARRLLAPNTYETYCLDNRAVYSWNEYLQCIDRNFVYTITSQLCRWASAVAGANLGA